MKALGIKDEHALQSWFMPRIGTFLAAHGRRMIGWDEILQGGDSGQCDDHVVAGHQRRDRGRQGGARFGAERRRRPSISTTARGSASSSRRAAAT